MPISNRCTGRNFYNYLTQRTDVEVNLEYEQVKHNSNKDFFINHADNLVNLETFKQDQPEWLDSFAAKNKINTAPIIANSSIACGETQPNIDGPNNNPAIIYPITASKPNLSNTSPRINELAKTANNDNNIFVIATSELILPLNFIY